MSLPKKVIQVNVEAIKTAGSIKAGQEVNGVLIHHINKLEGDDPLCKLFKGVANSPAGPTVLSLMFKVLQSIQTPDNALLEVTADAAVVAAIHDLADLVEFSAMSNRARDAFKDAKRKELESKKDTESALNQLSETENQIKADEPAEESSEEEEEPQAEPKPDNGKPPCPRCDKNVKKKQLKKAYVVPKDMKGKAPDVDAWDDIAVCSACRDKLNSILADVRKDQKANEATAKKIDELSGEIERQQEMVSNKKAHYETMLVDVNDPSKGVTEGMEEVAKLLADQITEMDTSISELESERAELQGSLEPTRSPSDEDKVESANVKDSVTKVDRAKEANNSTKDKLNRKAKKKAKKGKK